MENTTNTLVLIVIIVIFLFIAIGFKIKSDKKRKSLEISSIVREKNINNDKNEPHNETIMQKGKRPYLAGIPSWGLALLTMFLAFVVLMIVSDILVAVFRIPEGNGVDLVFYILYNLIIAGSCFYICRQNPKSILYVPVLCNIIGIISSIAEPTFWKDSLWIVICSGWVLSIIASIIGAFIGRRTTYDNLSK
jgi:hypothetical protein